jgi:hypothetical protein
MPSQSCSAGPGHDRPLPAAVGRGPALGAVPLATTSARVPREGVLIDGFIARSSTRPAVPGGVFESRYPGGVSCGVTIVLRVDGTLTTAHSSKQPMAGTFKGMYGFHSRALRRIRQMWSGDRSQDEHDGGYTRIQSMSGRRRYSGRWGGGWHRTPWRQRLRVGGRSRGHLGGLAGDQPAGKQVHPPVERVPLDRLEQLGRGDMPKLRQVEVYGGQRWPAALGHHFPVVDADDPDLLRHEASGFPQRVGDPAGDLVAAAEDPVEAGAPAQQDVRRLAAPSLAPLAVERFVADEADAGGVQCGDGPGGAFAGGQVPVGAGDVGDAGPAGGEQVVDRQRRALAVVVQQRQVAGVV